MINKGSNSNQKKKKRKKNFYGKEKVKTDIPEQAVSQSQLFDTMSESHFAKQFVKQKIHSSNNEDRGVVQDKNVSNQRSQQSIGKLTHDLSEESLIRYTSPQRFQIPIQLIESSDQDIDSYRQKQSKTLDSDQQTYHDEIADKIDPWITPIAKLPQTNVTNLGIQKNQGPKSVKIEYSGEQGALDGFVLKIRPLIKKKTKLKGGEKDVIRQQMVAIAQHVGVDTREVDQHIDKPLQVLPQILKLKLKQFKSQKLLKLAAQEKLENQPAVFQHLVQDENQGKIQVQDQGIQKDKPSLRKQGIKFFNENLQVLKASKRWERLKKTLINQSPHKKMFFSSPSAPNFQPFTDKMEPLRLFVGSPKVMSPKNNNTQLLPPYVPNNKLKTQKMTYPKIVRNKQAPKASSFFQIKQLMRNKSLGATDKGVQSDLLLQLSKEDLTRRDDGCDAQSFSFLGTGRGDHLSSLRLPFVF